MGAAEDWVALRVPGQGWWVSQIQVKGGAATKEGVCGRGGSRRGPRALGWRLRHIVGGGR